MPVVAGVVVSPVDLVDRAVQAARQHTRWAGGPRQRFGPRSALGQRWAPLAHRCGLSGPLAIGGVEQAIRPTHSAPSSFGAPRRIASHKLSDPAWMMRRRWAVTSAAVRRMRWSALGSTQSTHCRYVLICARA